MCQEFCPQVGGCLPHCMLGYTIRANTPGADIPGQTPPRHGIAVDGTHPTGMHYCYRPLTKFAKVIFLHLSVSHSAHRGEYLGRSPLGRYTPRQVPPGRYIPWAGTPPWAGTLPQAGTTPWAGTPPLDRYTSWASTPQDKYTPRQVHPPGRYIPQACTPPLGRYTPLPQADTPPLATVHDRIWLTSGQYVSHWNAFLF